MKRFNRVADAGAVAFTSPSPRAARAVTPDKSRPGPVVQDIGITISHGIQIQADDVNNDGGTCGPQVKIDNRDTGYHADNAVTLYADVAGMV